MLRMHRHASPVLAAVIAVTMIAVCFLAGVSSMPGAAGSFSATGPSLLAPHSAPFSAASAAANLRLHATRSGDATIALPLQAASLLLAKLILLPVLSGGHSIEAFSLRLRI